MNKPIERYLNWLTILIVIGVAMGLRLGWAGINRFALDEANIALPAMAMVRGGEFVYFGTFSSVGIPFFPVGTWLFAPPFLFTGDPLIGTLYIGMINAIAVIGFGWLLTRQAGWLAGWMGALLLASSPYGVNFSRFFWQPNIMIPMTIIWMGIAVLTLNAKTRRDGWVGGLVFASSFALQIHFAGVGLIIAGLILGIRHQWWRYWRGALIGGALSLLLTIPYFVQIACCSPEVIDMIADRGGSAWALDGESLQMTWNALIHADWERLIVGDLYQGETSLLEEALIVIMMLLMIAGAFIGWRKSRALTETALVVLVCMPLAFAVHSSPVNFYYMLPVIPAGLALVTLGVAGLSTQVWRWRAVVMMVALSVVWVVRQVDYMNVASVEHTPNAMSIPLKTFHQAAYAFDGETVIYHTHGDPLTRSGQARIFQTLWWDYPQNRIINGANLLILPPEPVVILSELETFQAWEELDASGLIGEVTRFPARQGEPDLVATRYDGITIPAGFQALDVPFEHGITLKGWKARFVGERLRISTLWEVMGDTPTEYTVQQFHHLYLADSEQETPDATSDVSLSMALWRQGDQVIVMGDFFPESDGEYQLYIGQYRLEDGVRYQSAEGDRVALPVFDSAELR
jgi:hypothetical protein